MAIIDLVSGTFIKGPKELPTAAQSLVKILFFTKSISSLVSIDTSIIVSSQIFPHQMKERPTSALTQTRTQTAKPGQKRDIAPIQGQNLHFHSKCLVGMVLIWQRTARHHASALPPTAVKR